MAVISSSSAVANHGGSEHARVVSAIRDAPFVCGTGAFGNLFREIDHDEKLKICAQWLEQMPKPVVIDTAGRYGAGMALESLGRCLGELNVAPDDVIISNKLGWRPKLLAAGVAEFDRGIWKGVRRRAEQEISYEGILACWRDGCAALGDSYQPRLASVHDPDEFLAAAESPADRRRRMTAIIDAYRALEDLKQHGEVALIGIGAKDWNTIREITDAVELDWVIFATTLTIFRHSADVVADIGEMASRGVFFINAGVFHSGFLVGGEYFDYSRVDENHPNWDALRTWRNKFACICRDYEVSPAAAIIQFAISHPMVSTVALNCDHAARVAENLGAIHAEISSEFWQAIKREHLISSEYNYVG